MKRKDATEVEITDGFHAIAPYVMPNRTEAEISSTEYFDITDLLAFLKEYNEKEGTELKLFHAFVTALSRTVFNRKRLNYFISGRKYWERNEISMSFVAKQKFEDNADERLMYMIMKPEMNLLSISKNILGDVETARKQASNDLDGTMDLLMKLPRWVLSLIFFFVRRLEYHGRMPYSLRKGDPNYSTALIANLGSIGAGAPYHHLSNYGTCSIMITIGSFYEKEGRTLLPCTFTIDERISDGLYLINSFKVVRKCLENPALLLEPIGNEVTL